jgi:hypothetical protein
MKERVFEKENNYSAEFQLRTKQYSHFNPQSELHPPRNKEPKEPRKEFSYYNPNSFENKSNNLEETSPYERSPAHQKAYEGRYNRGSNHEGIGNYAKSRHSPTALSALEDKKPRYNHL